MQKKLKKVRFRQPAERTDTRLTGREVEKRKQNIEICGK